MQGIKGHKILSKHVKEYLTKKTYALRKIKSKKVVIKFDKLPDIKDHRLHGSHFSMRVTLVLDTHLKTRTLKMIIIICWNY